MQNGAPASEPRKSAFFIAVGLCAVVRLAIGQAVTGQDTLAEIIVTAQKVSSSESKTPISMEVYDGKSLASRGVTDIASLAYEDPSLNFDSGNGEGYLTIRGVASHDTTEIGDPAVPIATDGFFVNRPYVFNHTLYDINRIEVLRGPQGTLYGANAAGGLVRGVTNDPTAN